jgi:hypothetical protein
MADTSKRKLLDADIMIWVKENEKNKTVLADIDYFQSVITHEMGHVLGLHHQFDKNVPSIMGYSGVDAITYYDDEALKELYPLILNKNIP